MLTRKSRITGLGFVPLLAALVWAASLNSAPALAAAPAAAAVTLELCANVGSVTMPDGLSVPIWGFAPISTSNDCSLPAQLPGPELRVNAGDDVTIILHNNLPVPTSFSLPGQVLSGVSGGSAGTFTQEANPGDTVTYQFNNVAAGTYLYESGTSDQPQTAMGLYGAFMVDPAAPGQAYDDASTAYDVEQVLVLSELDPALNADPSGFNLLDYNPTYWLLNGRAFGGPAGSNANPDVLDPDAPGASQPYSSAINADLSAGQNTILVRYLNAGGTHHTMLLLGEYQRVIARDADFLGSGQAFDAVAETIPSGHTTDVLISPTAAGNFPLFNRQLHLTNGSPGPGHYFPGGGMLTFLTATGVATPPAQADLAVAMTDSPDPATAGTNVTYLVTVTNNGPDQADNVVLSNTLPGGVTLVSATPSQGSCDTTITCNLGSIPFPGSATVTIVVTPGAAGSLSNTASVVSTTGDPSPGNESASQSTTVNPAPNKHIGDLDQSASNPPLIGWFATVVIRVDNATHGPVAGAVPAGAWSPGGTAILNTCAFGTSSGGTCLITRGFPDSVASVTFTVSGVTGAAGAGPYMPANNHDPDSGTQASNGTSITIARP